MSTETTSAANLRFEFGRNWQDFVNGHFDPPRVDAARQRLLEFLRLPDLSGRTFLDIGCGSGLHSLAAYQARAARVMSFDFDATSVATTQRLREKAGNPSEWEVAQASILDRPYVDSLPRFDIVYSWGVLHHTGAMWQAIENAAGRVAPHGLFYIALYTSDLFIDRTPAYWLDIKRRYNQSGRWGRAAFELWYALRFDILPQAIRLKNPLRKWLDYRRQKRGMAYWTDIRDWLGGWPMEFAGIAETLAFCRDRLNLQCLDLVTGEACSEYLFRRTGASNHWDDILAARREVPLSPPFQSCGGPCYRAELPASIDATEADDGGARSRWTLHEDGQPCGLAHCPIDHVRRAGRGRYAHLRDGVCFAASDDSDPNTNGRRYTFVCV